jgi:3-oxoadipate enol-lactonase/4-carboxymuconolactone decarboxylase
MTSDLDKTGMATRRKVLGDARVDASLARRTPFNTEFQAIMTRFAFGEIWSRPGLDERTRRLMAVTTTAALGRMDEFRMHVRAGLENDGFTVEELKETLLQLAVYAGAPAANSAFAEAGPLVAEHEAKPA